MATSLGYVLMNWTSTFSTRNRQNQKKKKGKESVQVGTELVSQCCQTIDFECEECSEKAQKLIDLHQTLESCKANDHDLRRKLSAAHSNLASTMEREAKLRAVHESLVLEEAQARYELDALRKQLADNLAERDLAHSERIQLLEQTIEEKECEWAKKNEALRRDLRHAIRSSIQDTEREAASLDSLEQEIESLRIVVEMRSAENRELRGHNNELMGQLDRLSYLESELANARHRLDEMTLVLQYKMDSEKELLELSESLQQELVKSRSETLFYKSNLENRQYLHHEQEVVKMPPPLKVKHSQPDLCFSNNSSIHRNHHQQASSGSSPSQKQLVMNVREKSDSVAWMIQMPTATSPLTTKRNIK